MNSGAGGFDSHALPPPPTTQTVQPLADVTLREVQPGDEAPILRAFNRLFARVDPGFRPRSSASWRWRYAEHPDGARAMLALDAEGRVLAQYAGLRVRLRTPSGELQVSHAVDSFCDPGLRGGLARRGLFARVGEAYAARFCGTGPGRDCMLYGLPVRTAWRVGRAQLGYRLLRPLLRLEREPGAASPRRAPGVELELRRDFPPAVDELFERCTSGADPLGAVALRDHRHLEWRFTRHPDHEYRVGLAHRGGSLLGYAVLRPGTFDGRQGLLVCDWSVAPGERSAEHVLDAWLAQAAQAAEGQAPGREPPRRTIAVFGERSHEFRAFQERGFRVHPSGHLLAGRSFDSRRDTRWWARHLHFTLADTDLV